MNFPFHESAGAVIAEGSAIYDLLLRGQKLADEALFCWKITLGHLRITLRFEDQRLGQQWSERLWNAVPGSHLAPDAILDFLSNAALNEAALRDTLISTTDMRRLSDNLAMRGISAAVPAQGPDFRQPLMFYSKAASYGLIWIRSLADLPDALTGAPFAFLFHHVLSARQSSLLHAGTLVGAKGGALLIGESGTGKSATTLSGVRAGLATVGDDFVGVTLSPTPEAWVVYKNFKQTRIGLERFPDILEKTRKQPLNWRDKVEFLPELIRPGAMNSRINLKAIFLPQICDAARTTLEPMPAAAVFDHVARPLLETFPGTKLAGFRFLTRMTRLLPGYRLRLSRNADEIGGRLQEFLGDPAG